MFGLAALAMLTAMAFIGTSSAPATATVLCKVSELVCPVSQKIEHANFTSLSTDLLLLTNISNVKCTHSIISGTALLLANPLVIHISLVDLTGCAETIFGSKCTVTTNNAGLLKLLKTGPNVGTLAMEGIELLFNCSTIGLHCAYGNPTSSLAFKGSEGTGLASISASGVVLPKLKGSFFCPEASFLDATYTVTTPDPAYIAE